MTTTPPAMGPTAMAAETAEAPEAVARFLDRESGNIAALGHRLAALNPPVIATCARGSSDHAANFLKYAVEILLGVPVASIGPSVASIYNAPLRLNRAALVSISQSGKSPDIVALQEAAKQAGALTIAFANVETSPLAEAADIFMPLHAGPELSVAATKSFIVSVTAAAALAAHWSGDKTLLGALKSLPEALTKALACDWSAALTPLAGATSLYTLGRGPAYPVAQEAALKGKETTALHSEAFSTAEVMHGPLRLVENGFPLLAFVPDDRAATSTQEALARLVKVGGTVFTASPLVMPGIALPAVSTGHGITDTIALAVSFYRFIETLTRARGFDPDRPRNLAKVTETV